MVFLDLFFFTHANVISTKRPVCKRQCESTDWCPQLSRIPAFCYGRPSIPFNWRLFSGELCVRDALWSHWLPIVCRGALLSCFFVMTVGRPLYRLNKITQLFIWGTNATPPSTPHPASTEALKTPQNCRPHSESQHIEPAQETTPVALNWICLRNQTLYYMLIKG